jgi:arylsulfatase A-like enzyme
LNQTGNVVSYGGQPKDYLTDVISGLGSQFIKDAAGAGSPFLLELATFAPHAPYTPAPRHATMFPGLQVPRTPAYDARPGPAAPAWLKAMPALDQAGKDKLDAGYRLRAQAVQAIDEMIASLQATLAATGHDKDTFIVFSGDNGYHMGEYSLHAGKQTAFDTDINVPLIVTGPGVPAGTVVDAVTENIDLCPTFSDLGLTAPPATAAGKSLVPFFLGQKPADWRNVALIEHHGTDDPSDPDSEPGSGDPPTYEAIRLQDEVYVEYSTGEKEYHDVSKDPYELTNSYGALPQTKSDALHTTLVAARSCTDAASCWAAQHYTGP